MFRHLLGFLGLSAFSWVLSGSFLERFYELFKRLGGQLSFPENHLKRPDSHLLALVSYLQRLDSQFQPLAATKPSAQAANSSVQTMLSSSC